MARAFIIMLDSFGLGATADAYKYGDEGANTLLHIAEHCQQGKANKAGVRSGSLHLPNLTRLGLNGAAMISSGKAVPGLDENAPIKAAYGCAKEISLGKDTQSGHWEMAGVPVLFEWGYFSPAYPSFPKALLDELIHRANLPGVLGNKHASGTMIIAELGQEHQKTGKPIVYTSADSVFQIAAHEETFGLQRLYDVCEVTRELVDQYNIGRVIARPFLGVPGHYYRTGNRRDYATPPPAPTLLDKLTEDGGEVIAIGKVADIYAHQGITRTIKADGNQALFAAFMEAATHAPDHSITFVNLVDFDMLYGHRRDVAGYAKALEEFDGWLPAFEKELKQNDLVIITADHGCDPTWQGSDHTREHVPVIAFGPSVKPGPIGLRDTFADIGQTLAKHLGLPLLEHGTAFI
ncbi:phosphopentomutase [Aquicella lusitana]|uniref:Phosphopentomutase n=1 Tax=Aquicella lusitana TaxID=254246 RepID=A0A370GFE5_9COXI|nr:phosphopentomutase [Aquicella lusitana]RDI42407.1 phosphopentomutase [Aquicella lusitana]VVC74131.1 Phosphopentomutase [Aquicella lusitana]